MALERIILNLSLILLGDLVKPFCLPLHDLFDSVTKFRCIPASHIILTLLREHSA